MAVDEAFASHDRAAEEVANKPTNNDIVNVACNEELEADHPQGDDIRRQVEYYFSDENLPNDQHLLSLCGGAENKPVSIGEIMSWGKMRRFVPRNRKSITAALRRSTFLEVVDGKRIRRRLPLVEDTDGAPDVMENNSSKLHSQPASHLAYEEVKPTEIPPWMTKKMLKPTGFEEHWCDAPTTPAEAKVEEQMYSPDNPFSERIEIAIQRYKSKRKFHQDIQLIFDNFMRYGGIHTGPRQFTGRFSELDDMDAVQIALAKATHFAGEDKEEPSRWAVDFEGVAKGYLSSEMENRDDDWVEKNTRVMMNFYNYILHHEVCPEYTTDILAARAICLQARRELSTIREAAKGLPGPFNNAVSVLYDGFFSAVFGDCRWFHEPEKEYYGQREEEARITLLTGLALLGSDALYDAVAIPVNVTQNEDAKTLFERHWTSNLHVTTTVNGIGLQVIDIEFPSQEVRAGYADQSCILTNRKKNTKALQPLGKLICKRWSVPDFRDYDLPTLSAKQKTGLDWDERFEFWIEEQTLSFCFVGMHLNVNMRRLEVVGSTKQRTSVGKLGEGIWVLDQVNGIFASFYTCLLNEVQLGKSKTVKWLDKGEAEAEEKKQSAVQQMSDFED